MIASSLRKSFGLIINRNYFPQYIDYNENITLNLKVIFTLNPIRPNV